jgi:shikimate kinase
MKRRLIFLIGYRGAGKTTVARLLAEKLGWRWLDADAVLEERAGKSIRQIFTDDGEPAFRDLESAVLRDLGTLEEHVIATGGGVVLREENRAILKKGIVVWLRAPADVLWQRMQSDLTTTERRPDLTQGGLAEVEEMLRVREPLYEACWDVVVEVENQTPADIAAMVLVMASEAPG